MVMFQWAIRKLGGGHYASSPGGDSFQTYLNIVPMQSYMAQKGLNIEIGTGLMHEYDFDDSEYNAYESEARVIYGVLGIINIYPISYLWVITEYDNSKLLRICGEEVYQISKVELIPLASKDKSDNKAYKDGIKRLLSSGFYFSYGYDLTKRLQRSKGDDKYWWNKNLYVDFKNYNISSDWAVKVIQGYVGHASMPVESHTMEISLISRRRYAMAGTRYSKRGIDDNGNVANFVESEQIIQIEDYKIAIVQIRGSVPAFWEQTGISANLKMTRNFEMDNKAFDKHFKDMLDEYDKIVWANLLNNKRSYELVLIKRFEELVKKVKGTNNRYLYFNFHKEWENNNFNALHEKLKVGNIANFLGYHIKHKGKTLKNQVGVFRSNWLDWLDRTNIWQAYYCFKGFHHLINFLRKQKVLDEEVAEVTSGEAIGTCK